MSKKKKKKPFDFHKHNFILIEVTIALKVCGDDDDVISLRKIFENQYRASMVGGGDTS